MIHLNAKLKKAVALLLRPKLTSIYLDFKDYTMITPTVYVSNLEIVQLVNSVPGSIVECGTWKGGMIAGIAKLLGSCRNYYLFDSFEGLPPSKEIDGLAAKKWQEDTESPGYYDNCRASVEDAVCAMKLAGCSDAKIFKGWFEDTLPHVRIENGISILRLDSDWYDSTKLILDYFFPLVNPGGLIIIDDYFTWDGCAKALHDYLSEHKLSERIRSSKGVCYLVREAQK